MNIISADKISKIVGDKDLFKDISFGFNENDKIGLIGVNGSGKSTLLKCIAGQVELDGGKISRSNQLRIGFLPQIPELPGELTIRDYILKISSGVDDQDHKIKAVLHQLNLTNLNDKIGNLSGGMMKKIALAETLVGDYDMLILDEPTNHLDTWTNIWLEGTLAGMKKALFMVTHDRYFLENVTGRIFELDSANLYQYEGNYSYFLEKKAEREEASAKAEHKAARLFKSELEWLRRQPKARGTKQKARVDRAIELGNRKTVKTKEFAFESAGKESKNRILELKDIGMNFGDRKLFDGLSYTFRPRERIGIVGPNGCGKSTFFNIVTGTIQPEKGSVVRGLHTRFGYFDQTSRDLDPSSRVIDYVKKTAGDLIQRVDGSTADAARILDYFGFTDRMQYGNISRLSGGERRRLHLVLVLMSAPNFLIFDEPTNDLDIKTLVLLEEFLADFAGCVLVASHDRYFLDRAVESLFVFTNEKTIEKFEGSASDYLEISEPPTSETRSPKPLIAEKKEKKKLTQAEVKEFKSLEPSIEKTEKRIAEIEGILSNPGSDYAKVSELGAEHQKLKSNLDEQLKRWEELAALSEGNK